MKISTVALSGALALCVPHLAVMAQTAIGFNIANFSNTTYDLDPTDSVGVVSTENWNNLKWDTGGSSPVFTGLVDSNGDTVDGLTAQLSGASFNYSNSTALDGSVTLPDAKMMAYGRGESSNGRGRSFTVENVSYELYDVYVYFGAAGSAASTPYNMPATLNAPDGEGGWTAVSPTYIMTASTKSWSGDYTISTSTVSGTESNYVLFENVDLSSFRITSGGVNRRSGYTGFQIVAVPEPSQFALGFGLLAMGCVVFVRRRKTTSSS